MKAQIRITWGLHTSPKRFMLVMNDFKLIGSITEKAKELLLEGKEALSEEQKALLEGKKVVDIVITNFEVMEIPQ